MEKKLITEDVSKVLDDNFSGLPLELIQNHFQNKDKKRRGQRHRDEVKRFALTLNFYSPKAYEYVRTVIPTLPHPSSMANWTSSVKCEPGLMKDVFEEIQSRTADKPHERDVTLICDGMGLHTEIFYHKIYGSYEGFVTLGQGIGEEEDTPAKNALVLMVKSLRGRWKYPIGYVLIDGIKAEDLHAFLSRALDMCFDHDIDVQACTMDGTTTNFSAMKKFGCKFNGGLNEMSGKFNHGKFPHPIYFIPDAAHMLKLARNALGDMDDFQDAEGRKIEWRFIAKLHDIQVKEGLKFANKISTKHVMFEKNKMSVKLAAQVLSSSVADAIQFLRESKDAAFTNSEGTENFIRMIDRLFDLLNSRNALGKGFKKPLRLAEKDQWIKCVDESIRYLYGLKDELGVPLLSHRRNTFVKGLIVAAKSVRDVALSLLTRENLPFSYVLTYHFSQDHLELLFSAIRSKGGFNNNPDVRQFKAALRKVLLRTSIRGSKYGNCQDFSSGDNAPLFDLKWRKSPLVSEES